MNLLTSIDDLKTRVDKTRSVQTQIAATWTWPLKTVAEWEADNNALDKTVEGSLAQAAIEAHTTAESARGVLDARLAAIHKITVAAVGVMRVRAERKPELRPVVDELSGRGDSRKGMEEEGTALLSAWKLEFDGAAFAPAPGVTYEGLRELFHGRADAPVAPSLRVLKDTYSDAATIDRRETGRLNARLAGVERDCVDWYEEATRIFAAGTEIGDLIRAEVPVSGGGQPAPPAPTPP